MSSLLPCTQCRRHVRAGDVRCPFCSAELTARALPRWLVAAPKGAKRATLFAIGMSLASACETDNDTPIYGGAWVGGSGGGGNGGAQGVDGGTGGILNGGSGGDNAVAIYGAPAPPEPDAGPDPVDATADATPATDAGDAAR